MERNAEEYCSYVYRTKFDETHSGLLLNRIVTEFAYQKAHFADAFRMLLSELVRILTDSVIAI